MPNLNARLEQGVVYDGTVAVVRKSGGATTVRCGVVGTGQTVGSVLDNVRQACAKDSGLPVADITVASFKFVAR
ncbi:hypothetical protein [Streptomyces sp. WM6349]|uniref:hypothetical protein n=1 Tax=Streptomyces sp. WM6349 TaxID=1415552 RepID=UPI0006AEAC26|nr:hypothetical protein [Streptomyces sp. WM6349]KOU17038.1 hypothetical protein ADK49_17005 [Streptomyces sp. WM6349]